MHNSSTTSSRTLAARTRPPFRLGFALRLMALRIHDNVVRGEIDNRSKGMVRGRIWLEGRPEPLLLKLKGNAHPDLAGCLLTFTNCGPCFANPHLESNRAC